jgi:hydrogenase nickel incorporation protein HypB
MRDSLPQSDQLARIGQNGAAGTDSGEFSSRGTSCGADCDIQTDNDAARLARFGFPVKQITTGGTCHLDASMVEQHLADWKLQDLDVLLIENVGNLVGPASYDLGETAKIVVLSVTEGEDKPLKYPAIFFKADLLVLNKIDLLPYVPFDVASAENNARRVHPGMEIVKASCLTGNGLQEWLSWLERRRRSSQIATAEAAVLLWKCAATST